MAWEENQNDQALEYALSISKRLKDLTASLFQTFELTTFGYKRVFTDGKYLFFSTNQSWVEYHIKNIHNHGHFFVHAMNHALVSDGFYRVLWPVKPIDHFLEALHHLGMWNGLNFYKKQSDSIELWTFSTSPEKYQDPNSYLSIITYLERFIGYFNVVAADILDPIDDKKLALCKDSSTIFAPPSSPILDPPLKTFLTETTITNIPVYGRSGLCYLSRQESVCLSLLAQGKSAKEIARLLNLSPRTVESYLATIKLKTGQPSKSSLIDIFNTSSRRFNYKEFIISELK